MLRVTIIELDELNREKTRRCEYCDEREHAADWMRNVFDWNTQWLIDGAVENPYENRVQIFVEDVKDNGCITASVQVF